MSVFDDVGRLIEGGAKWLEEVFEGPLKEWANTELGATLLRAMASSLTGGLAPVLGPQLASVAFALPGLARGESFDEAWWKEFCWRVEKTVEILGPSISEQISTELKKAGTELRNRAAQAFPGVPVDDAIRRLGIAVEDLAHDLGIRQDVAAAALSLGRRVPIPWDRYDAKSGDRIPLVSVRQALAIVHSPDGSVRAAISGQGTQGSLIRWMRALP